MTKIIKEISFGENKLVIETGEIARQASAAVLVTLGGSVVLVTVVARKQAGEGRDFLPLTVNYFERSYAAGKIPGGFLRREGRPTDAETLIARLIDRPLRPLFPKGFYNEVQVVAKVLSLDQAVCAPDILALIGASAVISIARLPFNGPIGAVRVGYKDGIFLLNPAMNDTSDSQLDLVVAGTSKAILMVESEVKELTEEIMLNALLYGHEMMQPIIKAITELADEVGNASWDWQAAPVDETLEQRIQALVADDFAQAYLIQDKVQRLEQLSAIHEKVIEQITAQDESIAREAIQTSLAKLEKKIVRDRVLAGEPRIDGRDTKTVRPITIRPQLLPKTHGSVMFTRGETQAIVVATLGNERDAQLIDAIAGERKDRFMLHYNFPPYSVGETGMIGVPKRREIGHGRLARRSIEAVLPSADEFPYVLRVVSEITESNGSSSMATVCGTSLALMDAGVPIKAPVAGIAMGLIKEGDQFVVLTDILGDEDHLGDMDFKVAGTLQGITALQMDIKIEGITKEIMEVALEQAHLAREHILAIMASTIERPRDTVAEHAPRIHTLSVHPDKIRDIIGKGGATIRGITEQTGVTIDISPEGVVKLFSPDNAAAEDAIKRIKEVTGDVEEGKVYEGTITRIVDFGAFVNLLPNKDGLVHISEMQLEQGKRIYETFKSGQAVSVKVLAVEHNGRIRLTMKNVDA